MAEAKLKTGDVVKLKIGNAPSMVVLYAYSLAVDPISTRISVFKCAWFDGSEC